MTVGIALSEQEQQQFRRAEGDLADPSEAFGERLQQAGLKPSASLLRWGDPAEAIVAVIAEEAIDAIVIGRRGRGRLSGLLLGSVSQKLVSLAPCIVIVVP